MSKSSSVHGRHFPRRLLLSGFFVRVLFSSEETCIEREKDTFIEIVDFSILKVWTYCMVVLAGITRIFNPEVLILYKVCHFVSWSTSGELSSTYAELKHCCLLHYKSRVNLVNCCLEAENPSAAANMTCAEYYILRISRWPPRWDMVIRIGKKWDFSVLLFWSWQERHTI